MLPGRLTRWKGQINFIRAINKLDKSQIHVLIVGSDQGRIKYKNELEMEIMFHIGVVVDSLNY